MLRRLLHSIVTFDPLACLLVLLQCWGYLLLRPRIFVFVVHLTICVLLSNLGWRHVEGVRVPGGLILSDQIRVWPRDSVLPCRDNFDSALSTWSVVMKKNIVIKCQSLSI